MKRLKIMKSYIIVWLFIYFIIQSNIEAISIYFFATLTFNLAVLTVLFIGIIMVMKAAINLVMLAGTFGILAYKKDNLEFYLQDIENIMPANIALMFQSRAKKSMLLFTADEARGVVEMIEEKFGHQNRYTNYFTGTVLMIGLLGTFSGLLIAIDDMGRIILSLSGDIDLAKVISDFSGPLGGMAVGFGSSLFGVVAAIILGLKGYILNKNQEQLINGVEDWLKSRTIDSGGTVDGAGAEGELPEHTSSFMDVFVNNLTELAAEMGKISHTNDKLHSITIASIQQARDEHETSIDVFEEINSSLKNIDSNAFQTTKLLSNQFNALQISMNTNHQQMILQQQDSMQLLIGKIESSLEATHTNITQKFQEISDSSTKEIETRAMQITKLLGSLERELQDKQKLLLEMQNDENVNQEKNEKLLNFLIDILKESSKKLDAESKILESINKQLDMSADVTNDNFNGIGELIQSFSNTLQSELNTLDALHNIQEEQSKTMSNSLSTSQSINETLTQTHEMNVKHEAQLNQITSKVAYVSQQIHKNNSESTEILNSELRQLHDIAEHSKNQDATLVEMLEDNKKTTVSNQENLEKISSNIDSMKEEFLDVSSKNHESKLDSLNQLTQTTVSNQENLEKISSNIDSMKEEFLEISDKNQQSQLESLDQVTQAVLNKKTTIGKDRDGLFGKLFK